MLCLKVAINETDNYHTYQLLFDFLTLSLSPLNKEPGRKLNK